jgi:hypothetical protein
MLKKIVRWWRSNCSVAIELATHKAYVYDKHGRRICAF